VQRTGVGQHGDAGNCSLRFPRSVRLLKHAAFDRVYREGRRIFSPHLTISYRRRGSSEPECGKRIGFTVGRVLGGAVDRNRIKRRLREAARMHLATLTGPVDVVINPKKTVLQVKFSQLLHEVESGFKNIELRTQGGKNGPDSEPQKKATAADHRHEVRP
jgi:ribonuclease P protein component